MQAVGSWIETAVECDGGGNFLCQLRRIGAICNKAAPLQFFQDAHTCEIKLMVASSASATMR